MKRTPSCYGAERDRDGCDERRQVILVFAFLAAAWIALIAGWQVSKLIFKPAAAQAHTTPTPETTR